MQEGPRSSDSLREAIRYPANVDPVSLPDGSKVLVVRSNHFRRNTLEEVRGASAVGVETGSAIGGDYQNISRKTLATLLIDEQYGSVLDEYPDFYMVDVPRLEIVAAQRIRGDLRAIVKTLGELGIVIGAGIALSKPVSRRGVIGGAIATAAAGLLGVEVDSGNKYRLTNLKGVYGPDATPEEIEAAKEEIQKKTENIEDVYQQLIVVFRNLVMALKTQRMNQDVGSRTQNAAETTTALLVGGGHMSVGDLLKKPADDLRTAICEFAERFQMYNDPNYFGLAITPHIEKKQPNTEELKVTYLKDEKLRSMLEEIKRKHGQ